MSATHPAARFLTISDCADQLGVHENTVRAWVKSGHLAAIQPAGPQGVIRIPEAELDRLAGDTTHEH